jgi:prevent-host-death family protein
MKVVTSREFNQDVSQAKRAARIEPVFVTDRGRPTHVLMSVETYRRLTGQTETIVDLLAMPGLTAAELPKSSDTWDGHQERQGRDG